MTEEIWKPVLGYEGRYEVSDQGRVRNAKGREVKPNRMTHGYTCVHLYNGKGKTARRVFTIHKLVALTFLANPNDLREVNHKNFCRADNKVENLEWVSRVGNVRHAIEGGRQVKKTKKVRGIHLRTGVIARFDSLIDAERALRGAQTGAISAALKHNRPAYGYVWWLA